ncbi:MAG: ATP-binding protein [Bacteroidales bacterium]|nr:ATP-binding protein [Bacteroidales bacterium]
MKFYNRQKEIRFFNEIWKNSSNSAQMTMVVGRRRIGKTVLLKKTIEKKPSVYLFVSRKSEVLLCEEFVREVETALQVQIFGEIKTFKALFAYLMELSKTRHFTVVLDEFQEFYNINPAVYSEMQNIWDSNKNESQINLILCGSMYSMMKKIFEHSKEPLFARQTEKIVVRAFDIQTIKEILNDYHPKYTSEDLLAFYLFTGGVAKYVELFVNKKCFTLKKMLSEIFRDQSYFLEEGKQVLIEEFGKDYGVYFSILSLIASSINTRSDIESILNISIGGYLERLENDFNLIRKNRPAFSKQGTKQVRYVIEDNFLNFWFRFIYKYASAIEIGNYDYVREIVERDYTTYSGLVLEKYFMQKLIEGKKFSMIGNYWESGKNANEIDIVAVNDLKKQISFFEVKRKKSRINIPVLIEKSENLSNIHSTYKKFHIGLSMEDM